MVYKALNGLAPEYISGIFTKVSESHMRNLRSVDNDLLRVPSSRTSYTMKIRLQYHQLNYGMSSRLIFVTFPF